MKLALRALAASLLAAAACSAPANLPELAQAERQERDGELDQAVASYRAAQRTCTRLEPVRRRKEICAMALLGEAELLERQGHSRQAIDAYAAIPARSGGDPPPSAQGLYRAGVLSIDAGDERAGWTFLWKVVSDFPNEAFAGDAVGVLVRDGRHRNASALAAELSRLVPLLARTQVADNLLWELADLAEHELGDRAAARAYYDRIPAEYPASGLRDDARWHAARLSREAGDARGAIERLRALVRTREVAYLAGSYFSIWLDDAQLELGRVLRDDLGDLPAAAAAFRRLPEDYPDSILIDDSVLELADTLARGGDRAGACAQLRRLAQRWPDSKYLRGRAPEISHRLDCPRKET